MQKKRKPSWWLVNGLFIGMITALFLAQRMVLTTTARTASQIGIVVFGYWLIWRWVTANAIALEQEEEREQQELVEHKQREAEQAQFERQNLNPQQIHYLKMLKAKRR